MKLKAKSPMTISTREIIPSTYQPILSAVKMHVEDKETKKNYLITLDDDPTIAKIIQYITGIRSLSFVSGEAMLSRGERYSPLAFFVDIMLPGQLNGLEVIPKVRAHWPFTPILVITSCEDKGLIGQALAAGANDFLAKPIDPLELRARLAARTREMDELKERTLLRFHDIEVDRSLKLVSCKEKAAYLPTRGFILLTSLLETKGVPMDRASLKRKVWGTLTVSENTLDKQVSNLRKALKEIQSEVEVKSEQNNGIYLIASSATDKERA